MIGEVFREHQRAFEPGDNPLSAIHARYAAALGTGKNPLIALSDKYKSVMSPSRVPANIRGPGGSTSARSRGVPKNSERYSPWEDGMFSFSPLDAKPGQHIQPRENAKGELSARVMNNSKKPAAASNKIPEGGFKNGATNIPNVRHVAFVDEAASYAPASTLHSGPSGTIRITPPRSAPAPVPSSATVTPPAGSTIKVTKMASAPWARDAARAASDPALTMDGDLKGYLSDSAIGRQASRQQALAHPQGALANRMNSIFGQGLSIANKSADRTLQKTQGMITPPASPESMGLKPFNSTPTTVAANTSALNAHMNAKRGITVKPALSATAPPKIAPGPSLDIPSIGSTLSAFKQRPLPVAKPSPVPRVPSAPQV